MKTFRKVLIIFFSILVAGVLSGALYLRHISRKGLPDYSKNIISGVHEPVEIIRDKYAVPHIYAGNEDDLYFATGYAMAQDRLWQMDLLRRLTTGRLSEIFGKRMINADQLFRSLNFEVKSRLVISKCSPEALQSLKEFARGVNHYIKEKYDNLPPEFSILGYKPEPWETVHSANLIGYISWDLSTAWTTESALYKINRVVDSVHVKELIPDMNMQQQFIYPDFSGAETGEYISALDNIDEVIRELGLFVFQGSNNSVISRQKSVTGKPVLANDMHLALNIPGIWYQLHQSVPGKLNVSGVALPGQPFIICGHNDMIAWGMTNVMLDDIDFYIETLNEDSTRYMLDGQWRDIKLKKEIIYTKEGDTVERINRFTHRGPIVSGFRNIRDKVISMHWTGTEYSNEVESVYKFNRAGNWNEFRDAARGFTSVSQNIVYADTAGNIGMQTAAGIPVRKGNGIFFMPGDTSEYDWTGMVPFEELPFIYNPSTGYAASANNRTVDEKYPYHISSWFDLPNRYSRIVGSLNSDKLMDIKDFESMQANQNSLLAENFMPVFIRVLQPSHSEMKDIQKSAFEILKKWDFEMGPSSIASAVFEQTFQELSRAIFLDELGPDLYIALIEQDLLPTYLIDKLRKYNTSVWCDDITTTATETFDDNIRSAFFSAIDTLLFRAGDDVNSWEWGKLHTLYLKHPLGTVNVLNKAFGLNRGPFPVGGSFHTVSPYSFPWSRTFKAEAGSSHRHIYSVAAWDSSLTVIPTGNSGIPSSSNYCDQTELYLSYKYHPDPFTRKEVEKYEVSRMTIKPE